MEAVRVRKGRVFRVLVTIETLDLGVLGLFLGKWGCFSKVLATVENPRSRSFGFIFGKMGLFFKKMET